MLSNSSIRMPSPEAGVNTLLLAGALVLALEPALWLAGTWVRDGYDGIGWLAFALVAGLAGWSISSPLTGPASGMGPTYMLLLATACIRLAAQILDVNVLGAVLLAVDVYALARLVDLERRVRAISPFWLAVLFCFSLPIEPMVQRLLGFDLQHVSAWLACGLLTPFVAKLSCEGVRLRIEEVDVLVDLPCSGAELISITALIFAVINTLRAPGPAWGMAGCLACVALALLGNSIRICLLAVGIARVDALGFNVMDPWPHTIVGLVTVALTASGLFLFARCYPKIGKRVIREQPSTRAGGARQRRWFAAGFLPVALIIGAVQPQPVDASSRRSSPEIPLVAAGFLREDSPLTDAEKRYFTRYGGGAQRAAFGPFGLLLVSTASPLRHLHDPTICLQGMGFDVRLLGTDHATNTTVYVAQQAVAVDDRRAERYTIYVTYRSDEGVLASSVSEVVWHWLRRPGPTWTMVQRIVPDHPGLDPHEVSDWQAAIRRSFNLS